jgi:hypothetical protein
MIWTDPIVGRAGLAAGRIRPAQIVKEVMEALRGAAGVTMERRSLLFLRCMSAATTAVLSKSSCALVSITDAGGDGLAFRLGRAVLRCSTLLFRRELHHGGCHRRAKDSFDNSPLDPRAFYDDRQGSRAMPWTSLWRGFCGGLAVFELRPAST